MTSAPFSRRAGGCHLAERVHDYVVDALPAAETHRADQHLLVCAMCRCAVEQERRIVTSLREFRPDPARQQQLMAGLLGLAQTAPAPPPPPAPTRRSMPGVVTCDAPPQYQSARHSLTAALVAVVGCAGVAAVVATAPQRTVQQDRVVPPVASLQVRSGPQNVLPIALARAEQDARGALQSPQPRVIPVAGVRRVP